MLAPEHPVLGMSKSLQHLCSTSASPEPPTRPASRGHNSISTEKWRSTGGKRLLLCSCLFCYIYFFFLVRNCYFFSYIFEVIVIQREGSSFHSRKVPTFLGRHLSFKPGHSGTFHIRTCSNL